MTLNFFSFVWRYQQKSLESPNTAENGLYLVHQFLISLSWQLALTSEKEMATHSGTLAWKIPWPEEPGGLQSMGSLRVGQD